MQKVIFTRGLPGSGKSTWAKEFVKKNPDTIRVCRDDLRRMRGTYWLPKQEDLITEMELACIEAAIYEGKNVIVDATNFNTKYIERIKDSAISASFTHEVEFEIKDFTDVPLLECIKRDASRPKEEQVGSAVIKGMYYKYLCEASKVKWIEGLPSAIICDLDGTLAIHNGRSPYDEEKCDTDLINKNILEILRFYPNLQLIFVSGRQDKVREKTEKWLYDNAWLPKSHYKLYMRKTGDTRNDSIVKREIFDVEIRGKYNIQFVLDDRNRVVEMWRNELGLTCFQVADGDF